MTGNVPQTSEQLADQEPNMLPSWFNIATSISRALPDVRGKRAAASYLQERTSRGRHLSGALDVELEGGLQLELPLESHMSWQIAFTGRYDEALVGHMEQCIEPDKLVLDVGASLGVWTVQLASMAAKHGAKTWAFEPNPRNTPWIRKNVAINALEEDVTIMELGLGDTAMSDTLVATEGGLGFGAIALPDRPRRSENQDPKRRIPIKIERLDDIVLPAQVGLIKIDTEGYEPSVLRGAAETIARDRPTIFGEFSPHWLKRRNEDLRSSLAQLKDYKIVTIMSELTLPWMSSHRVRSEPVDIDAPGPLPGNLMLLPQ